MRSNCRFMGCLLHTSTRKGNKNERKRGKGSGKEKSDSCRIRTCAGRAQQISSLSP